MAIGGGFLVVLIAILARGQGPTPPPAAPSAATSQTAPLPDLSKLTPREQFDQLYNRAMQASESGDLAAAGQFTPMALQAYGALESVDDDARYHAAMLRLHTGDPQGAKALTDTMVAQTPNHLLALMVRASLARVEQNAAGLQTIYRQFLASYDAETKSGRREYQDHRTGLERFLEQARAETQAKPAQ